MTIKAWNPALLPQLPTAKTLLADGLKFDMKHVVWDADEMKLLVMEAASILFDEIGGEDYADYCRINGNNPEAPRWKIASSWNQRADHFLGFLCEYTDPLLMVFGAKVMLTTYRLPLHPGALSSFNVFHQKAGDLIMSSVENGTNETDEAGLRGGIAEQANAIIAEHSHILPPAGSRFEAEQAAEVAKLHAEVDAKQAQMPATRSWLDHQRKTLQNVPFSDSGHV